MTRLPSVEDYKKILQAIDKSPYCYEGRVCRFRVHHRCTILKTTEEGKCRFYKEVDR